MPSAWGSYVTYRPFDYPFLDDSLARHYESTTRLSRVFGYTAVLSVIVASLRLLALVSYVTHCRTREVAIRKVIGASSASVLLLIYRGPLWLALVSTAIVLPLKYWAMQGWLEGFANRIELGPEPFLAGVCVAVVISILGVGLEGLRASRLDPAEGLKEG